MQKDVFLGTEKDYWIRSASIYQMETKENTEYQMFIKIQRDNTNRIDEKY